MGKERAYNRRFLQMCGHYLVEPVACTPASGWEKGQVENQVGLVRERFFTPRLRVKSYDELNAWLLDKCVAYAKAHRHPEQRDRRSGRCSRPSARAWCPMPAASTASMRAASVSKTCLVRFDNNKYSVLASAGRPARSRSMPMPTGSSAPGRQDRRRASPLLRPRPDVYDPWHYVPVLARKPGALRNGAPFKDWVLPPAWSASAQAEGGADDGDRQMVTILTCGAERRA
jgi:hypothetical protein